MAAAAPAGAQPASEATVTWTETCNSGSLQPGGSETTVDGVYICGACQGPKNAAESVASSLAAVSQAATILKPGRAELDPQVATVNLELCNWCGRCAESCPYAAIEQVALADGRQVASVDPAVCKGCGGCVPICAEAAIDLLGYTHDQLRAMIDSLIKEAVPS